MKNASENSDRKDKNVNKVRRKETQLKTIFSFLSDNVATATMVSDATGVPQKSICRYKRDLEKIGKLVELKKDRCQSTKYLAWYLTCNPNLFPTQSQLTLF